MAKFEKELEAKVKELFQEITEEKLTQEQADRFVNTLEVWMKQCIENGDSIQWTKFFTMKPAIQAARTGRNPSTGEVLEIPEKKTVRVSVSKAWKKELNQ